MQVNLSPKTTRLNIPYFYGQLGSLSRQVLLYRELPNITQLGVAGEPIADKSNASVFCHGGCNTNVTIYRTLTSYLKLFTATFMEELYILTCHVDIIQYMHITEVGLLENIAFLLIRIRNVLHF